MSVLTDHVRRLEQEHPPLDLGAVDFTLRDPAAVNARFGRVLDYMARVELEVDRNVRELDVLLPDPPDIDVYFYRHVWQPQETRHGQILDALGIALGRAAAEPDVDTMGVKLRILGALGRWEAIQDVSRMLYYLTGMSTEQQAVIAYNRLHEGLLDMGETAIAQTAIRPIKRQEPGHFAFYQMAAREHWGRLADWQRWLVRKLRALSYGPVGVNNDEQSAHFGQIMLALDLTDDFAAQVARVESELLHAQAQGMAVPSYVRRAFRDAVERAAA